MKTFLKLNRGENSLIIGTCRRCEFSRYAVNCWAYVRACVRSALNSQWNYARVRVRTHLKLSAVRHRPCLVDVDAVVVIVRLHLNFILCEFQHFQGLVSQICLCSLLSCPPSLLHIHFYFDYDCNFTFQVAVMGIFLVNFNGFVICFNFFQCDFVCGCRVSLLLQHELVRRQCAETLWATWKK